MIELLEESFRAAARQRGGGRARAVHVCKLAHEPYPDPSTALVFLLFEDDAPHPSAVAKVARSAAADAAVRAEWRGVELARGRLPEPTRRAVPENWAAGEINGRAYGLWSAQPGQGDWHHTFRPAEARRAGHRIRAALEWAARMAAATADGVITAHEWLGPWPAVRSGLAAGGLDAAVLASLDRRLPAVWETSWPAALVHGDFFAGNLLFEHDRISAVLDWGGAEARGPAFLDALNYELAFALHVLGTRRRMDAGTLRAFASLPPFRQERHIHSLAGGVPTQPGADARLVAVAGRLWREVQAGPARRAAAQVWMQLAACEAGITPAA